MDAEQELLEMAGSAVPILESLLNSNAKNAEGVPYRQMGLPLRCALETARRLGPVAKPLEPLLACEVENGNFVAAMALGSLKILGPESIKSLANKLDGDIELAYECAAALYLCGELDNEIVLQKLRSSESAVRTACKVREFLGSAS